MSQPIVPGSLRVPAQSIIDWATACLQALDMPPGDARLLAESLVQTSSWGIDSHGIARLPHYMERLSRGSIKARPDILVKETGPSTAQVHGDQGQGIIVGHRAAQVADALARKSGIGAVGAFLVGIAILGEQASAMRIVAALLIVSGLFLMKLSSPA